MVGVEERTVYDLLLLGDFSINVIRDLGCTSNFPSCLGGVSLYRPRCKEMGKKEVETSFHKLDLVTFSPIYP